ncbi:hypothetical protein EMIT0P2_30263 [Pseudomonas sp. IT-P2]
MYRFCLYNAAHCPDSKGLARMSLTRLQIPGSVCVAPVV